MPGSGIINIYTESVESKVLLSIQDCGGGIPPEIRDKLGTPFFTTKEQGTGLGLAICYQIVQRHSATLSIESSLGKGTTFTVGFRQS
jgi:signal transduction histidine kinase